MLKRSIILRDRQENGAMMGAALPCLTFLFSHNYLPVKNNGKGEMSFSEAPAGAIC